MIGVHRCVLDMITWTNWWQVEFAWYMFIVENLHMVDYMYTLRMYIVYMECNTFTWILVIKCLTCWYIHTGLNKGVVTIMLLYSQKYTGDLRVIHMRPSGHIQETLLHRRPSGQISYGAGQTTTQWYTWIPGQYIVCLVTTYKKEYRGICICLYDIVNQLFIICLCLPKFDLW